MNMIFDACARASASLNGAIDTTRRFPANVFVGEWDDHFFFDADWVFDAAFVECVQRLCAVDGAVCACLTNLDAEPDSDRGGYLCMDQHTTPNEYRSMLSGMGPESGWIYGMDRFGCTSDISRWCVYCEKGNEIAVIGMRRGVPVEQYVPILIELKAVRVQEALALPLAFGYSGLPMQWQDRLTKAYGTR